MPLGPTFRELDKLTDQNLRDEYDSANEHGQTYHTRFFLDELRRRESRRTETTIRRLTWLIALLTVVNVAAVVVAVFR